MAVNKRFQVKSQISEAAYKEAVAGTTKLGPGNHVVRLESVQDVESDQWHAYDLVWANDEGATFKDRIFITYLDRESGERLISNSFHKLGLALAGGDMELAADFFANAEEGAYIDVERMQQAISNKIEIRIGLGKKGYAVKRIDDKFYVYDIATGEIENDVEGQADFKDLADSAKELGIKLTYNRVQNYKVNVDASEDNKFKISTALENAQSGSSPKASLTEGF